MSEFMVVEEDELRSTVHEAEALDAVRKAFRALAEDGVEQPPPMGLEIPAVRGEVHVKGAYLTGEPVFAVKVASGFYDNADRGLPTGSGLVLVFDATTGFPLALLRDNGYLTELRTGAAGALAADLLAPRDVRRVAVIGAGVQARYQLRALAGVRSWESTTIWGPHRERAAACCREMAAALDTPCGVAATVEEAVADADVVVTVTPSREPLVRSAWLTEGVTIIAVGSDGPEKQELDADVLAGARVVADRRSQGVALGEIHHAVAAGVLEPGSVDELGDVLVGARPGREGSGRIVCDLTGVGAQDAAIAGTAWALVGDRPPH